MKSPYGMFATSARWAAKPDDVAVGIDVFPFPLALFLIFGAAYFHACFSPFRCESVGVINVDVERGGHVCFWMLVPCQMENEVAPVRECVGLVVIFSGEPKPSVVIDGTFNIENSEYGS
jgi:hypothetical protein